VVSIPLAVTGWFEYGWRLARSTWRYLYHNGYHDECIATLDVVLQSAENAGDPGVLGLSHNYLAATLHHWGRWDEAIRHIDLALALRQSTGDELGWATSLDNRA